WPLGGPLHVALVSPARDRGQSGDGCASGVWNGREEGGWGWASFVSYFARKPAGLPATQPCPPGSKPTGTRSGRNGAFGGAAVGGVNGRGEKAPPLEPYSCAGGALSLFDSTRPSSDRSLVAPIAKPKGLPDGSASAIAPVYSPLRRVSVRLGEASL